MGTAEGKKLFIDQLERRFSKATDTIYLSKASFLNLKESMDIYLYEIDKEKDLSSVCRVRKFFTMFHSKQIGSNSILSNS